MFITKMTWLTLIVLKSDTSSVYSKILNYLVSCTNSSCTPTKCVSTLQTNESKSVKCFIV